MGHRVINGLNRVAFLVFYIYHIYLAIRQALTLSRVTTAPFLKNPKQLDPSYMTDLNFWDWKISVL